MRRRNQSSDTMRVLVIQTAFAGDLILTLPMIQALRASRPDMEIDVLCIPSTAPLLAGHSAIHTILVYDKHGKGRNVFRMAAHLRRRRYDVCLSPHRSLRSAILAAGSRAYRRITFQTSSGALLYTHCVPYRKDAHEAHRNTDLLTALDIEVMSPPVPRLFPSESDRQGVAEVLEGIPKGNTYICVAPGSVWATKRWTTEGFTSVVRELSTDRRVVLAGGEEDRALCEEIRSLSGSRHCVNAAGRLGFLASASLIQGASLLISNDSAPVHLASAVGTPVVEIYGATVPEFGFTPYGVAHEIVQVSGLSCKPCSAHGGRVCPIGTFECMTSLDPLQVVAAARRLLEV